TPRSGCPPTAGRSWPPITRSTGAPWARSRPPASRSTTTASSRWCRDSSTCPTTISGRWSGRSTTARARSWWSRSRARAASTCPTILDEKLSERAALMGRYLMDGLRGLAGRHSAVREIRGRGLLIGVGLGRAVGPIVDACRDAGLLVLSAGEQVLRLAPPLIVDERDCNHALAIVGAALRPTA